jgi:hypothetical protein
MLMCLSKTAAVGIPLAIALDELYHQLRQGTRSPNTYNDRIHKNQTVSSKESNQLEKEKL